MTALSRRGGPHLVGNHWLGCRCDGGSCDSHPGPRHRKALTVEATWVPNTMETRQPSLLTSVTYERINFSQVQVPCQLGTCNSS